MNHDALLVELGRFAFRANFDELDSTLRQGLGERIIDIVGLAVGALALDTSASVSSYAQLMGGIGTASAIGLTERTSAPMAAFVNGVLAHSLDFDDTHLPSIVHPSASVVPAVLATAESIGAHGPETLVAVAVGLEVTLRIAMAGFVVSHHGGAGQSVFFEHGQHATSICGAIGSAVASAKLLGLDAGGIAHAGAIAASLAAGIIESNRNGGTVKRLHCGFAAQAGVQSAFLARAGITGAPTALEGRFGLFEALLRDEWSAEPVLDQLGSTWLCDRIFYKPYPANHFTHTGFDAARQLFERGIGTSEIVDVELGVAGATVRTIGEPIEPKRRPSNSYQAQFSGPFMVALGLSGRGHGLGVELVDFGDEHLHAPDMIELMSKIRVVASPECDAIYPYQFPAVLRVRTSDGTVHEARVLANRGGDKNPLSAAELVAKFTANTAALLDAEAASMLIDTVSGFAHGSTKIAELMDPLRMLTTER